MPAAASIRVLVVDDQAAMRALTKSSLQQLGFVDISDAIDGEDGLRVAQAKRAQLIISDFNMPKMDELDFLRAIRTIPDTQSAAFIMLTERADKELVQRAVQFGVNNYLVKPFTIAQLKQKLEEVFGALT